MGNPNDFAKSDSLWVNLPEILKSIPDNPIPVSLLAIVILSVLAYLLFKRDGANYRLAVFVAVFFGVLLLIVLLLFSKGLVVPKSKVNITKDITYSYLNFTTNYTESKQCVNFSNQVLVDAGYSEIRSNVNTYIGGGYFNSNNGVATMLTCVRNSDRYQIFGYTIGVETDLVRSKNGEVANLLNQKKDALFSERVNSIESIKFYSRPMFNIEFESPDHCVNVANSVFKLMNLDKISSSGTLVWGFGNNAYVTASCSKFSNETEGAYYIQLVSFGFGQSVSSEIDRFLEFISNMEK